MFEAVVLAGYLVFMFAIASSTERAWLESVRDLELRLLLARRASSQAAGHPVYPVM